MLFVWFALSILTDVAGQLCFKLGANRAVAAGVASTWAVQLLDRWTIIGIAIYAVEVVVWLRILSIAPLSLAYPLGEPKLYRRGLRLSRVPQRADQPASHRRRLPHHLRRRSCRQFSLSRDACK